MHVVHALQALKSLVDYDEDSEKFEEQVETGQTEKWTTLSHPINIVDSHKMYFRFDALFYVIDTFS